MKTVIVLFLTISLRPCFGQVIDPYSRMLDPRSIARLAAPDTTRTKAVTFHGDARWNLDSSDHVPNVAKDTGSGIITHIWTTLGDADSTCILCLYINDTLLVKDYYREFFQKLRAYFPSPLDTFANGANTCDVQIPYHRGFRISMPQTNGNAYFAIEWHWVPEPLLPWIQLRSAPAIHTLAETEWKSLPGWLDSSADVISKSDTLKPGSTLTLCDVSGPGMIECIHIMSEAYDVASLDSTWLTMYWDDAPSSSVHVPLKDFFLCPVNVATIRAFGLRADLDSGFISYLPMPFAVHARIVLERTGSTPLAVQTLLQYHREPIDRNEYGYFHADFNESNPTKYHVWHPIVHTIGRGRYIGMSWGVLGHPFTVYLEGNPRFQIDSDNRYYIEYTGAEDFFDAAWWFANGMFTFPFSGYTDFIDQFYRFNYLDCYEFTKSFDFDLQPGNAEDVYDHFRTVGYYYKHWTPFWTNRDTLVPGEMWTIAGSGYASQVTLPIDLGPEHLSVTTDNAGNFNVSLTVPPTWTPGSFELSVNGEASPEKYYVESSPVIRPIVDTLPITVRAGDSLWLKGFGFQSNERVSFYLDSIPMDQSTVANSNNEFLTMVRIPYVSDRSYLLVARGERSGNATAEVPVTVTRTIDYEFEDMMPPTVVTPGQCYAEDVSYYWEAFWSKQMFVYFKPDSILTGAELEFQFSMAHADTFDFIYHGSYGPDLGRYTAYLDGDSIAMIDGYGNTGGWMPNPLPTGPMDLGIHYVSEGVHHIRFRCLGRDDSATNYWIEPDCLLLRPTTYMPPTPGTILAGIPAPGAPSLLGQLNIYPNPIENGMTSLSIILPNAYAAFFGSQVSVRVVDILGHTIAARFDGHLANNSLLGTLHLSDVLPGMYFAILRFVSDSGGILDVPAQGMIVK